MTRMPCMRVRLRGPRDLPRPTATGPGWIDQKLLVRLHLRTLVLQGRYIGTDRQGHGASVVPDVV